MYFRSTFLFNLTFLLAHISFGQNSVPVIEISNIQLNEQTKTLFVTYSLSDAENDDCEISLFISENNGRTYPISGANATGEIGFPISPGMSKVISWEYDGLLTSDVNLRLKLVADDLYEIKIEDIVALVDSNRLRSNLEFIEGVRHQRTGVIHLQATKDSIENTFINAGLKSEVFSFMNGNYEAHNYLGTLPGTSADSAYFLVGGHFDTVSDSPGADDNGSAVTGMMESVAVLKHFNFKKTIKFVGFDLEETGLNGSFDFVNNRMRPDESLLGFFDYEMIGYYTEEPFTQTLPPGFEIFFPEAAGAVQSDSSKGNFITVVGNQIHEALADSFMAATAQYVPELRAIEVISPQAGTLVPDLMRSDHAPFWIAGHPALMLTDGANFRNPHYHSSSDKIETLNFNFMTNVVKATVATIAKLAEPIHAGIATAPFSDVVNTAEITDFGVKIFPNPTSNFINIFFSGAGFQPEKIKLISLEGKTVFEQKTNLNGRLAIPTGDFNKGVYFLQVFGNRGVVTERIFVGQ